MCVYQHLSGLLPRLTAFARILLNDYDAANGLVQEVASRALAARRASRAGGWQNPFLIK